MPVSAEPAESRLAGRSDFAVIGRIIEPGSRVLDLGCGEGELLEWLISQKQVSARGVEISPAQVRRAIARGVSVYQGDINEGLADYPDRTFDYVILSQTLQEVKNPLHILKEMLRVGRRGIVSFPNFGHWRLRVSMLLSGRAPRTALFPYEWYESPNSNYLTVDDFKHLAARQGFHIEHEEFLSGEQPIKSLPNLRAEIAVFLLA